MAWVSPITLDTDMMVSTGSLRVTAWKAGVSLDILCNCYIRANNNLNINIDTWTPVDSYLIKNWTQTHNQKLTSPYCHFGPSLPPYNWLTIDHCIMTELC